MLPFIVLPIALFVNAGASRPQSINLELETVLEFDKPSDIYFLKNVRKFLNKIKDILTSNTEKEALKRRTEPLTIRDFLKKGLQIVKSLNDNELRYILRTIRDEIKSFDTEDSFEEDLRSFINHKLDDFSRDPKKIPSNIDDFLQKTQTDKRNRKHQDLLNFMNHMYNKDDHSSFLNYLNKIDVFRRNSKGTKDELERIIRTIIRDTLNKYTSLRKNNKQMFKTLIEDYVLLEDKRNMETYQEEDEVRSSAEAAAEENERNMDKYQEEDEVSSNAETAEEEIEDIHTIKLKQKKRTKTFKKLTHITLYPSSIEVRQKKIKFRTASVESKTSTKCTSLDIFLSKKEIENVASNDVFANFSSESDKKDSMEMYGDKNRAKKKIIDVRKSETLRHKNSVITSIKSTTKMEDMERSSLESYEHFGSLYNRNTKLSQKIPTNLKKSTKNVIFNTIENKTSTTVEKIYELFNDNISTRSMYRRAYSPPRNKKTDIKLNSGNMTKFLDNNTYKINEKEEFNKSRDLQTYLKVSSPKALESDLNNSIHKEDTTIFDVNKFIKNSQIQNIEDAEKKKEIEKKMKEDLFFILSTTNATTEAYTDVFKDLEDAFNLS